jgi:hypothetical protein
LSIYYFVKRVTWFAMRPLYTLKNKQKFRAIRAYSFLEIA